MSMILALDIGSQLGLVYGNKEAIWDIDFIDLLEKKAFNHNSFVHFYDILHTHIDKSHPEDLKIIFEKPFVLSSFFHAQRVLFGLYGIIQMCFRDEDIYSIAPSSLKKFWCGNGHASKEEMIRRTISMGHGNRNEHVSDAIALYHYWRNFY